MRTAPEAASRRKTPPSTRRPDAVASDDGRAKAVVAPLVLIVDDNEDARELWGAVFGDAGYRVRHAADGQEALDSVAEVRPDAILMDLTMPVLDGWEATKRLKADEATADIFIIAVTAHATNMGLASIREVGADAVVSKPCHPDELLRQVATLIKRSE